jgi:hypothetical protein
VSAEHGYLFVPSDCSRDSHREYRQEKLKR